MNIKDVFRRYPRSEDDVLMLQDAVDAGDVRLDLDEVPPASYTLLTLLSLHVGGPPRHVQLCCQAALWMREHGMAWWKSEYPYPGGRSDLAFPPTMFAVEGGGTTIHKVLTALSAGWTVMVVPYPAQDVERPTAFIFRPNGFRAPDSFFQAVFPAVSLVAENCFADGLGLMGDKRPEDPAVLLPNIFPL